MSNHLAVATVTAALGQLAHNAAQSAVGGVDLRFGRPSAPAGGAVERRIHVYLYLVTPNAAYRNTDLPTRSSDGRLTGRARVALDLNYLLSFYGDELNLEPDRMLGAVARDLHARPVLDAQLIRDTVAGNANLTGSDLDSSIELVKFTPTQLSLEEMSRIWSVMIQTPHALSIACIGTVVLIDALESGPVPQAVLRRGEEDRGVETRLGPFAHLDSYWAGPAVAATRVPLLPSFPAAQLGARLIVNGKDLGGSDATVKFVHRLKLESSLKVAANERTTEEIRLTLPDDPAAQDAWAAGSYAMQVLFDGTPRTSDKLQFFPRATRDGTATERGRHLRVYGDTHGDMPAQSAQGTAGAFVVAHRACRRSAAREPKRYAHLRHRQRTEDHQRTRVCERGWRKQLSLSIRRACATIRL